MVKESLFKVLSIRSTSKIKYKQATCARLISDNNKGIVARPSFIIYHPKNNRDP